VISPHCISRLHRLSEERKNELRKILDGSMDSLEFRLKPLNKKAQMVKSIRGKVVGGNLVTTQSTFGTAWQMDTRNNIVFLEDIGERGYRVDRVLEHMMYLGLLQRARAVIFGPFVGAEEPNGKKSKVPNVLKAIAERLPCPVFSGIDSGHIPNSRILPFNTMSEITKNKIIVATGIRS
jgi:muramoyltetrapeptide carboxypeptidase